LRAKTSAPVVGLGGWPSDTLYCWWIREVGPPCPVDAQGTGERADRMFFARLAKLALIRRIANARRFSD
jgi:hypothetical protein